MYNWKPTTIQPMTKWALPIGLVLCKHETLQEREKEKETATCFLLERAPCANIH